MKPYLTGFIKKHLFVSIFNLVKTCIYFVKYLDEGVYNTYVIDYLNDEWALLMHCAEKKKNSRYLSALMLSRESSLGTNVKSFLREKLPQYQIDLDYMFEVRQDNEDCKEGIGKGGFIFKLVEVLIFINFL